MKKFLSMVLSLSMIASAMVAFATTSFAGETDPHATIASVTPLEQAKYESVMMSKLGDGNSAYEVVVDLDNLPTLNWARGGSGERVGSVIIDLLTSATDLAKIVKVQGINANEKTEDWGADKYGYFKPNGITTNSIKNAISIVCAPSDNTSSYPYANTDVLPTDGKLSGAFVFYVETKGSVTITGINSDITINHNVATNNTNTVDKREAKVVIGSTTPSGPSYSITKEYKDAANKGYVWDVTISDFNTTKNSAMANFKVSDDEKVSAEITGLDGIESDGSCNFAVILNTEKTLAATDGFTITFPAK